jgi:hypothetical protein
MSDHGHGHTLIRRVNPLSAMQENEKIICEIDRHPVGMFAAFAIAGILLLTIAGLCFASIDQLVVSLGIVGLATVIIAGFLALVSKIYWDNYWIVTDDSLTQLTRSSLFDREACQMSFANLEDVTAIQDGFWAHVFHYGVISAETAAATEKFTLTYCPNPHSFAQKILMARETFEMGRGGRRKKSGSDQDQDDDTTGKPDSDVDSYEVPS